MTGSFIYGRILHTAVFSTTTVEGHVQAIYGTVRDPYNTAVKAVLSGDGAQPYGLGQHDGRMQGVMGGML